jgi:hypothetical protein
LKAVSEHRKIIILGHPGSGKTVFLKYLALQCIEDEKDFRNYIPFFITLKDFAEAQGSPDLITYIYDFILASIKQDFLSSKSSEIARQQRDLVYGFLRAGRVLILLDGLDEVRQQDTKRVLRQIREFSEQFFENRFVISCRIASKNFLFEKFSEFEISNFTDVQIDSFAKQWFSENLLASEKFIDYLNNNKRLRELAITPLLLTLLCLTFEGAENTPSNRSDLYKEGLESLLCKWDEERGIEREQVFQKLSTTQKMDLLSKISLKTFEKGQYFFEANFIIQETEEFLQELKKDIILEDLQVESRIIFQSFETQSGLLVEKAKGLYSFSHLSFHEFFTARAFLCLEEPQSDILLNHIKDQSWKEVFLLAVEMNKKPNKLLKAIKNKIDKDLAEEKELTNLLKDLDVNGESINFDCEKSSIRAKNLAIIIDSFLAHEIFEFLKTDENLNKYFHDICDLFYDLAKINRELPLSIDIRFKKIVDQDEHEKNLHEFKNKVPNPFDDKEKFRKWLKKSGIDWIKNVIEIIERMPFNNKKFNAQQKAKLKEYYKSNLLLVDCLMIFEKSKLFSYDTNPNLEDENKKFIREIKNELLSPFSETECDGNYFDI